ncbi:peptidylprolyl isomerase [Lentisalinibacter salinarum]|uniref:peptidylprolyl isomerase n=1 Tax=Lentisalinibacter salinarum TaxID=2992239 RepID=UPI00386D57E1
MRATLAALAAGMALAGGAACAADVPSFPQVEVRTTEGTFVLELNGRRAPLTVAHFLSLVEADFYDGLVFHRIVPDFVIQGGGFTPKYQLKEPDDSIPNESGNGLSNERGTIAMARTSDPHSANTQFFISLVDNGPKLDPQPERWGYAVFGRVIHGMDVVDAIATLPTGAGGPFPADVPTMPVIIEDMIYHPSGYTPPE